MIRRIACDTIRPLAAAQVIVDLASAAKELIDNAIDAHATQVSNLFSQTVVNFCSFPFLAIAVTFANYGLDYLEVQDNGRGIPVADMPMVGRRSHTSKLASESELYTVRTLGFRGEALHSLAVLSSNLTITSKCHSETNNPLGIRLTLGHAQSGEDTDPPLESIPCNVGTTVRVEGLLSTLPVRREEWQRNARRHFARAVYFVQSYALAVKEIKIRCMHGHQVLFSSSGSGQMDRAYGEAFGRVSQLKPSNEAAASRSTSKDAGLRSFNISLSSADVECTLHYASARRKSADRQFLFINHRPAELASLFKRLNETIRAAGWEGYATIIVEVRLNGPLDANLTPDKRKVVLPFEAELIESLVDRLNADLSHVTLVPQVAAASDKQPLQSSLPVNGREELTAPIPPFSERQPATRMDRPVLQASQATLSLLSIINTLPDAHNVVSVPIACEEVRENKPHAALIIEKTDFHRMEIIGQYNCGFILTRIVTPNGGGCRVYIIDQHASDERFRLESLERSLTHTVQSLLQPLSLSNLGLDDVMFIDAHGALIREHGFLISRDNRGTLQITGLPRVADVQLEVSDFLEMLGLIRAEEFRGLHTLVRVKIALGYKACRSAIMIGDPLNLAQMTQVVRNLATLTTPWICAHGRPTIRVLFSST